MLPGVGSAATPKPTGTIGHLYNTRYCEIFAVNFPEGKAAIDVFSTVGLSRCPAGEFASVDYDAVKEATGAPIALPNGPSRWTIDSITGSTKGRPFNLGGLDVRSVATLVPETLPPAAYSEIRTDGLTEWSYRKGRFLRQLISPNGTRYALQSYSQNVDPGLTEAKLNRIASNPKMALPEGWRYRVSKVKSRRLILKGYGSTRVVQDGLGGVYQRFRFPVRKPKNGGNGGRQLGGIYNTRYCEIFAVKAPTDGKFMVDIFNTVGLNRCPAEKFKAVDYETVKQQTGAVAAIPNGPRRWTIDAISGATAGESFELSGLEVRFVASLETPTLAPEPFTELRVNRTTEWNYRKGRFLRQVISPNGTRYAMQAYTRVIDPDLTEAKLNRISSDPRMALPEGWRFRATKLRKRLVLSSFGSTRIVRDGLGSVYQRFRFPVPKAKPKR